MLLNLWAQPHAILASRRITFHDLTLLKFDPALALGLAGLAHGAGGAVGQEGQSPGGDGSPGRSRRKNLSVSGKGQVATGAPGTPGGAEGVPRREMGMALEAEVDVVEAGEMMIVRAKLLVKGLKTDKDLALRWRVSE